MYTQIKNIFSRIFFSQASKDASLLMILQIVTQINNLISMLIITRYLGPSNMGTISFVQTFIGFTFLVNTGIDNFYIWELASYPEKRKDLIKRFFSTKLVINVISLVVAVLVVSFFPIKEEELLVVGGGLLLGLVTASLGFLANLTLIEKKVKEYFIAGIATTFSVFALRIIGIAFSLSVEYFLVILLGETLLLISYLRLFKFLSFRDLVFSGSQLTKTILGELNRAKYYIGIVLTSLIFARADQLFIKTLLSSTDLGLYAASVRLTELPMVVMGVLTSVIIPRITVANNPSMRSKLVLLSLLLFAGFGILFMLIFMVFGKTIISILYGDKFLLAVPVLAIYAMALPGIWINSFANLVFASYQKIQHTLYISIAGSLFSLSLLTLLVPKYGLHGAAISAVASYTFMALTAAFIFFLLRKKIFVGILPQKGEDSLLILKEESLTTKPVTP